MFFELTDKDLEDAEKNYYNDIEITKDYLKRVLDDLKHLTEEIENLL